MEGKHTPGPWEAEFGVAYNVRAPHGGIIAQISRQRGRFAAQGYIDSEESAANARLIAAAPDLLEACEKTLEMIDAHREITAIEVMARRDGVRDVLCVAIAKAKGVDHA